MGFRELRLTPAPILNPINSPIKLNNMNPNKLVSEIMTRELITVKVDTVLAEVRNIFEKNKFHHIPVLFDGDRLIGIISKQDLTKAVSVLGEKAYATLSAKDVMTEYPMCVDPDDTIGLVADVFLTNLFHALPVMDDGDLVGIVTAHDLLKFAFKSPVETDYTSTYTE